MLFNILHCANSFRKCNVLNPLLEQTDAVGPFDVIDVGVVGFHGDAYKMTDTALTEMVEDTDTLVEWDVDL